MKKKAHASKAVHYYDADNRYQGKTVIQGNVATRFDSLNRIKGREVTVGGTTRVYDTLNNEIGKSTKD